MRGFPANNRKQNHSYCERGARMFKKEWVKATLASLAAAALVLQPLTAAAQDQSTGSTNSPQVVDIAPKSSDTVSKYLVRAEDRPSLSHEEKLELLRKKIKYVFVLFQENRSFDFYFGTYPGARGLFSQSASETPGFTQPI